MLIFYFAWVQIAGRLTALNRTLDIETLTPADYTVMLVGVSTDISEAQFKEVFEHDMQMHLGPSTKVQIARITFAYDLSPFTELINELQALKKQKAIIDNYRLSYKTRCQKRQQPIADADLRQVYPPSCTC